MQLPTLCTLPLLFAFLSQFHPSVAASSKSNRVLLSNIRALTLRKDAQTSHRRVTAIPQLKCVGGTAKGLYEVDILRCHNAGAGYNDDDVQWTCNANLPTEFKLGSTDVICEGYADSDDPYVLKGSCGVEYRLLLTDAGEEAFGKGRSGNSQFGEKQQDTGSNMSSRTVETLFWIIFIGVVVWMLYAACIRGPSPRRRGAGGFFGGWGGDGGDNGDDPPPPYTAHPTSKPAQASYSFVNPRSRSYAREGLRIREERQRQRPGFWTGAAGGALAGATINYLTGNGRRGSRDQQPESQRNGEGSTRRGIGRSTPSYGSYNESTGFGGTRRR